MIPLINTAYIFSKLGNSASLLPIATKDAAHSAGMTTASYITGDKTEGKDRFIDEFGTQAIWLGGLPFFKKAFDLTAYKIANLDSKIDIRVLKNKDILKKAIEKAQSKEVQKELTNVLKKEKLFKNLFLAKFIAATVMTLGSYFGLTMFRHKHTEKALKKEIEAEIKQEIISKKMNESAPKKALKDPFTAFQSTQKTKALSFGSGFSAVKDFMFNPVKNLMIVDGGITAERLGESRNPQDFMGYVIKEGSFWMFMYYAGDKIQEFFENLADKKSQKSVALDIRALMNKDLKEAFEAKDVSKSVTEILDKTDDVKLYEHLFDAPDNLVVKLSKLSDIIQTDKDSKIDTRKFIDLVKVRTVAKNLQKLYGQFVVSKESTEDFFKKVVKLKKGSISKNILSCVGVLGLIVPGMMLISRYMDKDNKEFQVKKQLKEQMRKQANLA